MKIIKPSVEFFGAVPTDYDSSIRFIEMAGRTCYKSEDKITDDSAEKFVKKLINAGHLAMVEHSNFVVCTNMAVDVDRLQCELGKYLVVGVGRNHNTTFVGGNLTAWAQATVSLNNGSIFVPFIETYGKLFDQGMIKCPQYWRVCSQDEIPKYLQRYSVKFICDRAISHELVRHRPCSFAQESTRYVNYGGKDMKFIEPTGYEDWGAHTKSHFEMLCAGAEQTYKDLLHHGLSPQQARAVLPNALKTEIIVTADAVEWNHIRSLRTSKAAHPDMQRIMNMMPWEEFL
jgi:thymidylate synthase (FAD)